MNTQKWTAHFRANTELNTSLPLPVGKGGLPAPQRAAVGHSLAIFQLGETGGGTRLFRWHRHCRALNHVAGLGEALQAFIAEEQGHGAMLARVLARLGIEPLEKQWTNSVFRWLRNAVNLEFNMQVLLTAELIAEIYYGMLHLRCPDPAVRAAAGKILRDEMQHLRFQREFLVERLQHTGPVFRFLWRLQFRFIHAVTVRVVAWDHRRCIRAVGSRCRDFIRRAAEARRVFERRLEAMLCPTAEAAGFSAAHELCVKK